MPDSTTTQAAQHSQSGSPFAKAREHRPARTDSSAAAADTVLYVAAPAPASYNAPAGFVAGERINTAIVDSIAADTVPGRVPHFVPVREADSLRAEALAARFRTMKVVAAPSEVRGSGIEPASEVSEYTHSTPLTAIMAGVLIVAALNSKAVGRALRTYRTELWNVRRRSNLFDDSGSVSTRGAILLGLIFVIFGGIVLYNCPALPSAPSFAGVASSMLLAAAYYIFQTCAYWLVGYAFATPEDSRRWMAGFNATQAYSGLAMALPAILMVCCPEWHEILLIIAISVYELTHLIFILKGFRIFYRNFVSLLYFILYLCTLEIIPQVALYRISEILSAAV